MKEMSDSRNVCVIFKTNLCVNFLQKILCFLGAYVPLTTEGNIIVDGVLASCYPSADHDSAHLGMKPLHWFPEIIQWIFGEENGFSAYVRIAEELGKCILPDQQI